VATILMAISAIPCLYLVYLFLIKPIINLIKK
jgi:hypothetical protein